MELDFIKTELQKYNIADAYVAQLAKEFMPLKVAGIEDKAGLKIVHDARMVVKGKRLEVEKKRKELKESSLRFGQAVDGEAKRIVALLSPIEAHLENEESIVEREKERLRLEAEQKEQEKIRVAEQERLAEIERQRKTEEERIAAIQKELEAERERQAEVARTQIEAANRIKADLQKIEDEKRLIAETKLREEQEKKRLFDLEKAKQEAAEKARIETENRIKRESEQKIEAVRQAEIEAKRKKALEPDKNKLLTLAALIDMLEIPIVVSPEVSTIIVTAKMNLGKISQYLVLSANKL